MQAPEPRVRLTSKPLALVVVVVVLSAALSLSTILQDTHRFPTTLRGLRLESDVTAMRKDGVKNAMKFVWSNYHTRAFGADEMTPLDGLPVNEWGGIGCMLLDSMDTLWIMDLHAEFEQAKQWVHKELSFESMGIVSVFETIIRSLGGLLSAYDLSGDDVFLGKAMELAERLLPAINTTTGRAFYYLDAASKSASRPGGLAESGSYQLEFEYLSRASGDPKYANLAKKLYPYLLSQREIQVDGLFANDIFQVDSAFKASSLTVTMGGGGDSFYEYLLKVWLLQGQPNNALTKQMYLAAIDGMEKLLLNQSTTGHTYIGDFDLVTKTPVARLAHLACFVPGLLALGADRLREEDPLRSERHLKIAKQLMETCYKDLYLQQPSRLSPEYVQGPLLQPPPFSGYSAGYKLRPEVVESLYVMHQLTGDSIYQEWGWQIFTAIDRNCRTRYGYAQYLNVQEEVVWSKDPQERAMQTAHLLENKMETFFPAETLKYLYLLFDVDNRHVRLDTHVFNTEAHPLSIFRD